MAGINGAARDTRKYEVFDGNKKVHGGITKRALKERLAEHQLKWPKARIKQVGVATTEEAARTWEKEKGYTPGGD